MAELNNTSTGQWSEIDTSNTSASPDGWPSGCFPNQVEPIGRSTMGALKRFWDRINSTITSGGSANAYTYTPVNPAYPTAYVKGETYSFVANFTNTGAATVNINGLGGKNIYKKGVAGPIPLVGGEIQTGDIVKLSYDGTQFQILNGISSGYLMANSATLTPVANSVYTQTSTFLTLTPGEWELDGTIFFTYTPSTAAIAYALGAWASGDGNGSASVPTALSTVAGTPNQVLDLNSGNINQVYLIMPRIRMLITASSQAAYLVPFFTGGATWANARLQTFLYAKKVY